AELVRGLAREPDLSRLRARISLDPGEAHAPAGSRGDVDDASVAPRLHSAYDSARADERARQVRVDDGLPVLVRDLLDRPADLAGHAAGVVDEDVDAADLGDEPLHLLCVRDVDGVLVAAVHDGPGGLERGGYAAADALGGA